MSGPAGPDRESFPILLVDSGDRKVAQQFECPRSVPMAWIRRYERKILENHGQPLAGLVIRDPPGLDPRDLHAAVHGMAIGPTLTVALRWLATRPWYPHTLEAECPACGGTFKAQAEGDFPDQALRAAVTVWRNAHSGRCGHGMEVLPDPFEADRWPFTRLSVVSVIAWPDR